MFLEFPWVLTALVALPTVFVIYLLRNRSKRQVVSALFLWSSPNQLDSQGQRIQKIHSSWLMGLELLILALLVLTATDVHILWTPQHNPTLLILDDSWSMQTSKDRVLKKVELWVSEKKITFPVQIVTAGKSVKTHNELTNITELNVFLAQWTKTGFQAPECTDATLKKTILKFRSSGTPKHVIVITDQPRESLAQDGTVIVVSVGKPEPNLAFISAVRYPSTQAGTDTVIAEIANLSDKEVACIVRSEERGVRSYVLPHELVNSSPLSISDERFASFLTPQCSISIPAEKTIELKTSVPSNQTAKLTLPKDALAIDNTAILPPLPKHTIRVRLDVTNKILLPAVKKAVELAQNGNRKVEFVTENEDLLFTDRPDSKSNNNVTRIEFYVPTQPLDKFEPTIYKGPYIADSSNELLTGTDFSSILWGVDSQIVNAIQTKTVFASKAILSVGDVPLIIEQTSTNGAKTIRVALIPELSNLTRSPNFPIFLYNIVKQRSGSMPGLLQSSISMGETFVLKNQQETSEHGRLADNYIIAPDNSKSTLQFRFGQAVYTPNQVGLYKFTSDKTEIGAVNAFNPTESDLRICQSGEWGNRYSAEQKEKQFVSLRVPLLLLVLILATIHQILVTTGNIPVERKRHRVVS